MKNRPSFLLLLMLIVLIAVGQMTQTIYVPAIEQMALSLHVPSGELQRIMGAYLLTYGASQLIYGPLSDRFGRRPMIFIGMGLFSVATLLAIGSQQLSTLVIASALQGLGTGVGGVMARTLPRDLYQHSALRSANSLLNMGILISPLIAPLLGSVLASRFGWRSCYEFLLALCLLITFCLWRYLPETRPAHPPQQLQQTFRQLLTHATFCRYLVILVCALSGVAVFEASCGVLLSGVLKLDSFTISLLFISPIPAAFLGAWYAGRRYAFHTLMWQGVLSCLLAGLLMALPGWLHFMTVWSLLIPAALFFFGAGMLFPLATTGAMEPFPYLAGTAGALVGGLQNMGSGFTAWLSALLPQHSQLSVGLLMLATAVIMLLCWLPLGQRGACQVPLNDHLSKH